MHSSKRTSLIQTTSSPEICAHNQDLLTKILLHLPIKSLLKFKSVSKSWLSLISNPYFALLRNPNPSIPTSILLSLRTSNLTSPELHFVPLHYTNASGGIPPFRSLDFINNPSGTEIVQSCNGLLLCCTFRSDWSPKRRYYVCNPSTKQVNVLPRFRIARKAYYHLNLAFDPSKSLHCKVVCVCYSCRDDNFHIQIYSSETRRWRTPGVPFLAHISTNFQNRVFWNGAMHWIPWRGTSLLVFDLETERFREVPMLPIPENWEIRKFNYFGNCNDHLLLIEIRDPGNTQFSVFEMPRDYSGWIVKYCVDLDPIAAVFPELVYGELEPSEIWDDTDPPARIYWFSVLCIVREEDRDDSYMVLYIPGKAVSYNFKSKCFKKICDIAPRRSDVGSAICLNFHDAHQYAETLLGV